MRPSYYLKISGIIHPAAPKPRRKGTSTVLLPKLKTQTKLRRAWAESAVGCIVYLAFWRLI
jgi:hypothetical protein